MPFTGYDIITCISGGNKASVCLMNDLYSTILNCIIITNFATVVGGTIIDQNDFKILVCLIDGAVNTFRKIFFDLINGNNNRNKRRHNLSSFLYTFIKSLSDNRIKQFTNCHLTIMFFYKQFKARLSKAIHKSLLDT